MWGADENACYLDYSDGFTVYTHTRTDQNVHFKCVQFLALQLYLTEVVFKKRLSITTVEVEKT